MDDAIRLPEHAYKTRTLVDVAMGRTPADLVVRDGRWVCVQSGEIIPATQVAVKDGYIAYVGPDASHTIGEATRVIEAADRYLVPGLLDAHMHVESGMLTVTEFARAVIPHGTTGMFLADRIYLPGEMEWERREAALAHGILLPPHVLENLRGLAQDKCRD